MKITPIQYKIETETEDRPITYKCKISKTDRNIASLKFPKNTSLCEMAECVTECFNSEELKVETIKFKYLELKIEISRKNLKEISEAAVWEEMYNSS